MAKSAIRVRGLRELARGFHRISGQVAGELDAGLLVGAKLVEHEAHQLIREQRLVGGVRSTGRLDQQTKAFIRPRTGFAGVRSGAMRAGFNYPRIYEFGGGRRSSADPKWFRGRGSRAFLYPALERSRPAVLAVLDRLLDRLAGEFNRGGTP